MSYSVGIQPEQLPIIQESTLIINQGGVELLLGNSRGVLSSYGAKLAPGDSLVYDLRTQRYIASSSGLCQYDILPGATAAVPGATSIASELTASGLANAISASVVASSLATDVAAQVLATGTRVIDVPTTTAWGPLDHGGSSAIFDVTDAQSVVIPWSWAVSSVANLSAWGALTVNWYADIAGTISCGSDVYEMGGNLNTPGTVLTSETAFIRTPCKGAALKFTFTGTPAPGAVGRISASGNLVKSYRLNPINRYETDLSGDRVLKNFTIIALGALALSPFILCSPYDGPLEITANASSVTLAGGVPSFVQYGWGSTQWPVSAVAGRKPYTQVFFPQAAAAGESFLTSILRASSRRPLWIRFGNSSGAAVDFTVNVICSTLA